MAAKRKRSNTNPTTAGGVVASIVDVLTIILLQLPIKPLFRFKLVSKGWLSLISSRRFSILRNPAPNPSRGLFLGFNIVSTCRGTDRDHRYEYRYIPLCPDTPISHRPSLDFNFTTSPSTTVILHSCNGLLLCASSKRWNGMFYLNLQADLELYVYNPTSRFFTILPHFACKARQGATLVFDPFKSPHYKVVLVDDSNYDFTTQLKLHFSQVQIRIYSSETGVWTNGTEIGGSVITNVDFGEAGVYWNGSIHWRNILLSPHDPGSFLRYHVDSDVFHEMPSPPVLKDHYGSNFYFGESCGHLHFIEPLNVLPQLNVYEMKSDYSEWFVKYQVDLLLPLAAYPEVIHVVEGGNYYVGYVVSLIRGHEVDDKPTFVLRIPGKVLKYNTVDGTLEKLDDIGNDQEYISCIKSMDMDRVSRRVMHGFPHESGSDYIEFICNV